MSPIAPTSSTMRCRAVRRCRRSSGLSTPVLDRDASEPVILHELSVSVRDQVEAAFALCLARSTRASAMLSLATQMSGAWLWQRADDPGPIWSGARVSRRIASGRAGPLLSCRTQDNAAA